MAEELKNDAFNLYFQWLHSEIQIQEQYHDKKEKMAWIATGSYLTAIIALSQIIRNSNPTLWVLIIASILIGIGTSIVLLFIHMQFKVRWVASDTVDVLTHEIDIFLHNPKLPNTTNTKNTHWPSYIQGKIDDLGRARCFRNAVCDFVRFRWKNLDLRWQSELPSYTMAIIGAVEAILIM